MKRLLLLSSLLLLACSAAEAQQSRYDGVVVGPKGPLANQYIAVCSQPANTSTTPCSPLITLYSSSTGASSTNPIQSDAFGNFHFYATQGIYTVQIYGPQVQTPFVLLDQVVGQILTQFNLVSNPQNLTQDSIITNNYDNLFSYQSLDKTLTNTSNEIGLANINQMSGTAGVHGAYGFYNVADFTNLNGSLGVGLDSDTYYLDNSVSNANVLPGQANSTTTRGSANYTSPVVGYQAVVVHLGSGVDTFVADFLSPNSSNLGTGSIGTAVGFAALDQKAVGTSLSAGFWAAPQTACGSCYGFYSTPTNNDLMGNLTFTSLQVNGGGTAALGGGLNASGPLTGTVVTASNSLALANKALFTATPTISSGFGTGATVQNANGTAAFRIGVGTGGVASSGVVGMPTATAGWSCYVANLSAHASNRADDTVFTASTTTTVTVQNQTKSTGAALAWSASDVIYLNCVAF